MLPKTKTRLFVLLFWLSGCSTTKPVDLGYQYLNVKYQINPLGEEKFPDTDPLIRFDAFDCTTFVETVLANGDKEKLTKIRYKDGKVDFINRNHFMETDWIPNNKFENVSHLYGKTNIRHIVIDKKSWVKHVYNTDINFDKQSADIEYIPYENLSKIDIQTPLIVLFIHDGDGFYNKIGTDLAIIHMGFLLPGNILRHASRDNGRVIDVNFEDYVNKRKQNKHNLGISLVKIK
jgi:hypothetical protein